MLIQKDANDRILSVNQHRMTFYAGFALLWSYLNLNSLLPLISKVIFPTLESKKASYCFLGSTTMMTMEPHGIELWEVSDHLTPFYTQLIWAWILGQRKHLRNMFAIPYMQTKIGLLFPRHILGNFYVHFFSFFLFTCRGFCNFTLSAHNNLLIWLFLLRTNIGPKLFLYSYLWICFYFLSVCLWAALDSSLFLSFYKGDIYKGDIHSLWLFFLPHMCLFKINSFEWEQGHPLQGMWDFFQNKNFKFGFF